MKAAIMQPYFFPYIGYFQLIKAVDSFILCDNLQFTKKSWMTRNRFLLNGKDSFFMIPVRADDQTKQIRQRELAADYNPQKLLRSLQAAYKKAPFFKDTVPLIEKALTFPGRNLFEFLYNSILETCRHLLINTPFSKSSEYPVNEYLHKEERVIAICKSSEADTYINPIGGTSLYSKERFLKEGLTLQFLQSDPIHYRQFENAFVPQLSILDVLMFNSKETITDYLNHHYSLV
ncbi:MAG: hypothetical protein RLZZ399_376 [Verrucomicrobiota bacterium]|jgi:hypothetical protein